MMFVWFLFNHPADNLGDTLIDNAQAYFTLGLRDKVMRSILGQAREYVRGQAAAGCLRGVG